ncbi:hypothetical protein ACFWJ4_39680 [Kitasatospora sp. NPDC127067]|uniref:hypothetical protein n=1 Tax=Kitasatospora sp. NPDC127067 TaxID=3347126 RepID=UPI00366A06DD
MPVRPAALVPVRQAAQPVTGPEVGTLRLTRQHGPPSEDPNLLQVLAGAVGQVGPGPVEKVVGDAPVAGVTEDVVEVAMVEGRVDVVPEDGQVTEIGDEPGPAQLIGRQYDLRGEQVALVDSAHGASGVEADSLANGVGTGEAQRLVVRSTSPGLGRRRELCGGMRHHASF